MLSRFKKHFAIILVLVILAIAFVPGEEAGAFVTTKKNIRIGLYYASGSKDTTQEIVTMSGLGGIEIGTVRNGSFTKLLDTPYIINATLDGGATGYHIRLSTATSDPTKLYTDLNEYLSHGLEAFPVCLENDQWQIWEGCYLSNEDALRAVSSKIVPAVGAGNYTVSLPDTDRIIIKYSNGLAAAASESRASFLMIRSAYTGDPKTISVNGKRYRTSIELRKYPGSDITVINELSMGDYLGGVVPLEIGTTNTPFEALKAQAVAARTYAVANQNKHESIGFDLCNTTDCQVYGGYEVENLATNNAIKATEGMVATYYGVLAQLYYFASSGGATANSENVWSKAVPYLQSVEDPYEETRYWSYTFTADELTRHMANIGRNIGTVTGIEAVTTSDSGRVTELKVIGTTGTSVFYRVNTRSAFPKYLPSQVFSIGGSSGVTVKNGDNTLESINLNGAMVQTSNGVTTVPSTQVLAKDGSGFIVSISVSESSGGGFTITGAGAGHGVGMSQLGAMGMASAGFTYDEILKHYFIGVQIEKAEFY